MTRDEAKQLLMMSPRRNHEELKRYFKDHTRMRPETLAVLDLK